MRRTPLVIGLVTFVLGTVIAVALFAVLDVNGILLVGPVIGIGCAAYAAYATARDDGAAADDDRTHGRSLS